MKVSTYIFHSRFALSNSVAAAVIVIDVGDYPDIGQGLDQPAGHESETVRVSDEWVECGIQTLCWVGVACASADEGGVAVAAAAALTVLAGMSAGNGGHCNHTVTAVGGQAVAVADAGGAGRTTH